MTSQSQSPQPQEKVVSEPQKPPSALTQLERARLILQSGKISLDPKLHLFNVLGSGDRPYRRSGNFRVKNNSRENFSR